MKPVFVSYSRHNLDPVTQLIHDLNSAGVPTWYDQTLTGGQRWWDNILTNIRECEIFIFALSPESWESEACRSELGYVVQLGKTILPVLVADGINLNLLPHPLSEIQVTDCRSGDKNSCFALVKSIYAAPPAQPLPNPLPAPPAVPVSYLSNLNDRIESPAPLSSQEQITLLFELEEKLREGRSPTEVRDLLLRLKKRDDLLAKIATQIDAALQSTGGQEDSSAEDDERPEPSREPYGSRDSGPVAQARFCPKCRTPFEAGSKFCKNCGCPLKEAEGPRVSAPDANQPRPDTPTIPGSKSFRYTCPARDNPKLVADVEQWLQSQNFDTQQVRTDSDDLLLQIKKRGKWRDYIGMATSLNIAFQQAGDTLTVQIGAGNWVDKAAAGTVGMLVLWPLAFTAGYGIWEQKKMPEKIFNFIGSRLSYR
jgi:hypothetical protein